MHSFSLPEIPSPCHDFIPFLAQHPDTPVSDLIRPFQDYDNKVREGFAQHRDHDLLQDACVNAVPIFAGHADSVKIRARSLSNDAENEKYIFPLNAKERKPTGASAIVNTLRDFKQNFNLFSESSLVDLDWSNVVAAGSSVVTSLLPVPEKHSTSKRALREYYHQILAPSSDVDLFIYGLDESAALEKIKQIETHIRNSILAETTTIRTKNAITIASQYPVRHVQIVARLYKSISEILTGFDVDCSCFAYDGGQVYGAPRAIAAFITQINIVDLSRRSPSYESRLSKYSYRGFEVYWPLMERDRIDPTIFERSFPRTMGLARLLVLETLPKPSDREQYLVQRRSERGRPALQPNYYQQSSGNMKDNQPDDIAEWVYEDNIANYNTFTVPYGPRYNAKKIEKLLFMKDLLLNAEWNTKKDRSVSLHRHPCFIGNAQSVIHDCCGTCPQPTTEEEREAVLEESKIYVSGNLELMKDDPGRQTIGSFNPLTDDDWTDMAYIGNTTELCQAICAGDLQFVQKWAMQENSVPNRRDPTGRTPLQLAVQCSYPEIVQCLIDNGARIVARLVDGLTALHIAAWRGDVFMVNALLERSEANEEDQARKEERAKAEKKSDAEYETKGDSSSKHADTDLEASDDSADDEGMKDTSSEDSMAMTEGSYVKIKPESVGHEALIDIEDGDPDVYDVNVLAWDSPVSPLHLAILGGHVQVVELLVSKFGADVLLPVKILDYSKQPSAAILTLVLAAQLPSHDAIAATKRLLALGASSAQADMKQHTPVSYAIAHGHFDILREYCDQDPLATKRALSHVIVEGSIWDPAVRGSMGFAIRTGDENFVKMLLELGAKPQISFGDFLPSFNAFLGNNDVYEDRHHIFVKSVNQPIIEAVEYGMPMIAEYLLHGGADANTLTKDGNTVLISERERRYKMGTTLLDVVNKKISSLEKAIETESLLAEPIKLEDDSYYLGSFAPGTYQHWQLSKDLTTAKRIVNGWHQARSDTMKSHSEQKGRLERLKKLVSLKQAFETLRRNTIERGGKTFENLHPDIFVLLPEQQGQCRRHLETTTPKPFTFKVNFSVPENQTTMNGKREVYLKLFEASWNGDESTVKDLTMSTDGDRTPLHIAVVDEKGFSPFSIAICRGHFHLAKTIFEIADAQYEPSDQAKPRRRYLISDDMDDDDEEDESMSIYSELVDDIFTIENIAALTKSVGSKTPAADMLQWQAEFWMILEKPELEGKQALDCLTDDGIRNNVTMTDTAQAWDGAWRFRPIRRKTLIDLAIAMRDMDLVRLLLRIEQEARLALDKRGDSLHIEPLVQPSHFQFALKKGFMEIAGELIAATGVSLPVDHLVERSGIKEVKKPKYYQGLMLYGKHKSEWAQERESESGPYRHHNKISEESLILTAAGYANLTAVEWFLSDTPARLYKQYCIDNKDKNKLVALSKAHGGFDKAIHDWFYAKIDLALHHALQGNANHEDVVTVIEYLVRAIPSTLEGKDEVGLTPLALAFSLGKIDLIPVLLALGADQTTRTTNGCNLLHLILSDHTSHVHNRTRKIEEMLSLLDKRLIPDMLVARSSREPTDLTPLARWILDGGSNCDVFAILAKHMTGEEVVMLDGSGQRPIHQAIKQHRCALVATMLHHYPDLLYMENAMGQTPLELAESLYIRHIINLAPKMHEQPRLPLIENRDPSDFIPGQEWDRQREDRSAIETDVVETWRVCKEAAERQEGGMTRKLVSVTEAAEVAKRLAEKKKREMQEREAQERDQDQGTE
ncbi:hypothetical protein MMC17_007240 [Xylographa soralifera]|nr:hypothetical protein [Xylographa soralifera]